MDFITAKLLSCKLLNMLLYYIVKPNHNATMTNFGTHWNARFHTLTDYAKNNIL